MDTEKLTERQKVRLEKKNRNREEWDAARKLMGLSSSYRARTSAPARGDIPIQETIPSAAPADKNERMAIIVDCQLAGLPAPTWARPTEVEWARLIADLPSQHMGAAKAADLLQALLPGARAPKEVETETGTAHYLIAPRATPIQPKP